MPLPQRFPAPQTTLLDELAHTFYAVTESFWQGHVS
jgi:hypothetical protein